MISSILALAVPLVTLTQSSASLSQPQMLAMHEFSLENRYPVVSVNDVFKDNILLATAYATGQNIDSKHIDFGNLEKPFTYTLTLRPGETFAFHGDVLPSYDQKVTKTTNVNFGLDDGFKTDGYLVGDGVCHLASLLYWVAKDAGLDTLAPTRHDFAVIPEVPQEYGTSIYNSGTKSETNEVQNLYITNNKENAVTFIFENTGKNLVIKILQ